LPETVLCTLAELGDPGAKGPFRVRHGGREETVFVVRHGDHVRAYIDSCPHAQAPLEMEPDHFLDITGGYVLCTMHGAHFDPANGLCVLGPCKGRSLTPYPVHIRNGKVIAQPPADGV
jgi:nitrite reductase/ring-hydroxylating ferredoxin subunit